MRKAAKHWSQPILRKMIARSRQAAARFWPLPAWCDAEDLAQEALVDWLTAKNNCVWPVNWFWRRQATWLRRNAGRSVRAKSLMLEPSQTVEPDASLEHDYDSTRLTPREREILALRRQGYSLRQIGAKLGLSEGRISQILSGLRKIIGLWLVLALASLSLSCATLSEVWRKAEPHVIRIATEVAIEKAREYSDEISARLDEEINAALVDAKPEWRELARETTIGQLQEYEARLVKRIEQVKEQGFTKESARKTAGAVLTGLGALGVTAAVLRARKRRRA